MASQKANENESGKHERRKVVGLEEFATGPKGAIRAIEQYKVRKEKKNIKKAALFRSYKKVMKQEGYQLDQSPRKRKHTDKSTKADEESHVEGPATKKQRKERTTKKLQKKRQQEEVKAQMEAKQKQLKERQKQRQLRAKNMSKRTKRGQPIMKNVISGILEKLEKK